MGMSREEAIRKTLDTVLWTRNVSDDNKNMLIDVLVEALEQEPTTKNDLGVDCISRADAINAISEALKHTFIEHEDIANKIMSKLPSVVTPQEPQTFKWCTNCREYDQEKHCCHRWSKVIRDTVEEMKEEYIEREALDKIRAEIIESCGYSKDYVGTFTFSTMNVQVVLSIIDKYKTERCDKE